MEYNKDKDNENTNTNTNKKNLKEIDLDKFTDTLMDNLSEKERLGVMYFAGIKALKEKIEDSEKLLYKLALPSEDNVIFSVMFFLFVILTGNNEEVKNTMLKCKEEEFSDNNIKKNDINKYIDEFNSRIKVLAKIYLDVNNNAKNDEDFQRSMIKEFSTYLLDELKIDKSEDAYNELEVIFLSALKIAFGFIDAEKSVKSNE